ncbi:MAG: glycosyltransferase family 2 protein [Myxococcota bacterium]
MEERTTPTARPREAGEIVLDVVVVSWNTRDVTDACLASVFENLGDLAAVVWVVDNGSGDGSADLIATKYPQVRLLRNDENLGFAAANNQALRRARGRYALLLNSDTLVLGDVLQRSVRYMNEHPDVGVFGCRVLNPDRTLQPTCFQYPSLLNSILKTTGLHRLRRPRFFGREHMRGWQRDSERDVDVVTGCYMLVRRAAMEKVGLLDDDFFFNYEETDWCLRFRREHWAIRFAPVGEIIHIGNASGRQISHQRETHLIRGKIRLHRKHGEPWHAAAIWALAYGFWCLRLVFWGLASVVPGSTRARQRIHHARAVLRDFPELRTGVPS